MRRIKGGYETTGRAWEVEFKNYTPADIDSLFMETEMEIVDEKRPKMEALFEQFL